MFKLNHANDYDYDGELRKPCAPAVVNFSASYWKGSLPTISPYPRCNGDCPRQASRILLNCDYIGKSINDYSVYWISNIQKENKSYKQFLLFFVENNDLKTKNWCKANLKGKEYNINKKPQFNNKNEFIPIYCENEMFYSIDMDEYNFIFTSQDF